MAKTLNAAIVPLRSETPSAVPSAGSMETGELAVNINDKTLFVKDSGGSVVSMPIGDVTLTGTQTLTNKTLTSPTITGAVLNDGFTEEGGEITQHRVIITLTDFFGQISYRNNHTMMGLLKRVEK